MTLTIVGPAGRAVALCFVLFGIYNTLAMPVGARVPIVAFDLALIAAGSGLFVASRRRAVPPRVAHPIMATLALAVVANVLLALWLWGEPSAVFYVALVMVLLGGGVLERRWAFGTMGVMSLAWALVAAAVRPRSVFVHELFALAAGWIAASLAHVGRRREFLRVAAMRARDASRERALEQAFALVARARDELDEQVEARTAELRDELAERERVEQLLRHAQKMEAVGRLAGGIAHDFNNLLTVILSGLSDAHRHAASDPRVLEATTDARDAAERAVELTRGLLAFGRKQAMNRVRVAPGDVVAGVERLLSRLADTKIHVVVALAEDAGDIVADRGQVEQVLINLAINAFDAMPDGGTLRVTVDAQALDATEAAARGVSPGEFVRIAVADTGMGMDEPTRAAVFEPFFTTKPAGRGTGLGLAIVHGIVMQHGGAIEVHSELGRGSEFRVLLPRAAGTASAGTSPSSGPPLATGHETVLLVEDEPGVRRSVVRTLEGLGYRVIAARDGEDALRIAASLPAVDILVSDVVMPGVDGPEVAARLRERWPQLPVLFLSGYTPDRLERASGKYSLRDTVIAKPFRVRDLAMALRATLAAGA